MTFHLFTKDFGMIEVEAVEIEQADVSLLHRMGFIAFETVEAYGGWWDLYNVDGDILAVFYEDEEE